MKGQTVYQFVKEHKVHKGNLAEACGLSVRTLGDIYHDEVIAQHNFIKLRKGFEKLRLVDSFDELAKKTDKQPRNHEAVVRELELTIKAQGKKIDTLANQLSACRLEIETLKKPNDRTKKASGGKVLKKH